jgi:hypothetical protein
MTELSGCCPALSGVEEANLLDSLVMQRHQLQHGWGAVLRIPRGAEQVALEDGDAVAGGDLVHPLTDSGVEIAVHDVGQGVPTTFLCPCGPMR